VIEHYEAMLGHYGTDVGVRIARKHIAWYSKGLTGSAEFRAEINQETTPESVRGRIRRFFEPLLEKEAA
jgi:tRNA-dihydrouridine synthase B